MLFKDSVVVLIDMANILQFPWACVYLLGRSDPSSLGLYKV